MFQHITRTGTLTGLQPRIYVSCHKDDLELYLKSVCADIFAAQENCAVFYEDEPDRSLAEGELEDLLSDMRMVVVPVTQKLLRERSRALDTEIPAALRLNIPVLPILFEEDDTGRLIGKFNNTEIFGGLQFLNKYDRDPTALRYQDKLAAFLSSVLISESDTGRIHEEFSSKVFLSYRKKDRAFAQELMRRIHSVDVCRDTAIWYDEYLIPGESFDDNIMKALNDSDVFIMSVSPAFEEPGNYVADHEYPDAVRKNKPLVAAEMKRFDQQSLDNLEELYPGINALMVDPDDADDRKTAQETSGQTGETEAALTGLSCPETAQSKPRFSAETGETYSPNELIVSAGQDRDGQDKNVQDVVKRMMREDQMIRQIGLNEYDNTALLRWSGQKWTAEEQKQHIRELKAYDGVDSVSLNYALLTEALAAEEGTEPAGTENSSAKAETERDAETKAAWDTDAETERDAETKAAWDADAETDRDAETADDGTVSESGTALKAIHADTLRTYAAGAYSEGQTKEKIRIGIIASTEAEAEEMKKAIDLMCPSGAYSICSVKDVPYAYSSYALDHQLTQLIAEDGCRVVCVSAQQPVLSYAASQGSVEAQYDLEKQNDVLQKALIRLDSSGRLPADCLICTASGDQNDAVFEEDEDADYGYSPAGSASEYAVRGEECLAEYNLLNGIGSEVWDKMDHLRLLCAGAAVCRANDKVRIADYSQTGDPVKILAPGEKDPANGCGTALAAARISAAAADVFISKSDASLDDCVSCLLEAATQKAAGSNVRMIDCKAVMDDIADDAD